MKAEQYDIVIVGAGLIGSTLALSLAKHTDYKIAVLERSPQMFKNSIPNQRVVALGAIATQTLREIDVLDQLGSGFCHPYERMFVWDENSDGTLEFNAAEHDQTRLGHMIDSTQCALLLQAQMSNTPAISTFYDIELQQLELDSRAECARLLTGNKSFTAPLIVAADGGRSWVRQRAKIFANRRAYDQQGIVARIQTEKPHQDTAWQRFLSTGPLAILPIEKNQSSIVWSADNDFATQLMSLSDSDFAMRLSESLENKLGDVSLLSAKLAFSLHSQKAERYFRKNIVLVGDAAHSIHPLAGQGANLGFKDAQALTEILASATARTEIGSLPLLARYQQARKADNEQTDLVMSALHHAYQNNTSLWLAARGFGMSFLGRSGRIKTLLARQAMGL